MAEAVMQLRALAERVGILPQYIDNEGQVRETSDETRCALLAALGFEVTDEESARRTLAGLEEESAAHIVEPVRVAHESDAAQITARSLALVPGAVRFEVVATNEASGRQHQARGSGHVRPDRELVGLRAPALSPGTYRLAITLEGAGPRRTIPQWLAIVPATCTPVTEVIRRAAFGIWANLYSVRSGGGVGIGNLDDLRELVRFAASAGAEFMGINPLHALRNRGFEISPYSPLSRLFRNALYVAPARVPELAASRETARLLESSAFARELERARRAERIDYDLVAWLHRRILDALWQTFRTGASEARRREFERFRAREGVVLRDFATFSELDERMRRKGINDWRAWPADLRDPDSESVARFRMRNSERVDYHAFVQFECDRQLAAAARTAERAGMAIGLYSDLAVASLASSFDAWEFPGLFVRGACLGAPPDPYSAKGQNWRIPPLHPRRLRAGQ